MQMASRRIELPTTDAARSDPQVSTVRHSLVLQLALGAVGWGFVAFCISELA